MNDQKAGRCRRCAAKGVRYASGNMHEGPGPANYRIVAEEKFNLSVENVESLLTVCVDMWRRLPCARRESPFHQRKGPICTCTGRLEEHGASSSAKHFALAGLEDNRLVSHIHLHFSSVHVSGAGEPLQATLHCKAALIRSTDY